MAFWTIEEVAEYTGMTVAQVREARRRKEWPGDLGRLRGRRLMFDADLVQAGPTTAESTTDPLEAILWTLQGIEGKLDEVINDLTHIVKIATVIGMQMAQNKPVPKLNPESVEAWRMFRKYNDPTTGDEEE